MLDIELGSQSPNNNRVIQKNIWKMLCPPLWKFWVKMTKKKSAALFLWILVSYVFYSVFIPPGVAGGQRGSFEPVNLTHSTSSINRGRRAVWQAKHARPCFIWLCWFMQRWRKARELLESRFSLSARPSCQTRTHLLTSCESARQGVYFSLWCVWNLSIKQLWVIMDND